MNGYLVYTAPWIVPVDAEVIRDGAIVVNSDMIVTYGARTEILERWNGADVIELTGVIMPPLVNSHIHLELSLFSNIQAPMAGATMVDWIEELLSIRLENRFSDAEVLASIRETMEQQFQCGVVLLGDISNVADFIPEKKSDLISVYSFYEMLAPNKKRTAEAFKILKEIPGTQAVSPHSLYSTTAQLITALKKRSKENNHVFSIHLAESEDEIQFITTKEGVFRDFLERRKSWDNTICPDGAYRGAIDYLNKLGVLDEKTLCVHCVHIADEEIDLIAEKKAKICICPGSNNYLGVGTAPLAKMLQAGLLPAIGTDSLTSNKCLDLWNEMKILRKTHPGVSPQTILKMATLGGAEALSRSDEYGTLEKGKKPVFLEVQPEDDIDNAETLLDVLTSGGKPKEIRWQADILQR